MKAIAPTAIMPTMPAFRRTTLRFASFACIAAVAAAPAFAQEAGDVTTTTTGWIFRWINFAIIFFGLIWAFSKAGPYFRRHSQEISQRIAEGARAREAAEKQRHDVQEKLARVDADVAQMRADAQTAAAGEARRLRAIAKQEAQTIERAGQAEIAAAEHAARLELRVFAGRLAIERAEALLRERINADTEAAVFRVFVETLEGSQN